MNQSRPLPTPGFFTQMVKEIVHLIVLACLLFLTYQPCLAIDPEIKRTCQSEAGVSISSGIAHDGITEPSEAEALPATPKLSPDLPYKYFGNSFSGKFHRPWCPYSQAMKACHVVPFHFRFQAIDDGFKPCNFCLPQQWKSVHCILLKQSPAEK